MFGLQQAPSDADLFAATFDGVDHDAVEPDAFLNDLFFNCRAGQGEYQNETGLCRIETKSVR